MVTIAGAFYYRQNNDQIVKPHETGEFKIVDCDIYYKLPIIETMYDEKYIKEAKTFPIEYNGEKFYSAECSPVTVDEHWILLSDISELHHIEENYSF